VRLVMSERPAATVVNFDALTYAGNPDNVAGIDPERHQFVRGDITNVADVLDAMPDEVDAVINFAAETHVDRSIVSAIDFVTTNILGTQVLLDVARGRRAKRFVQVSTDEVMGSLGPSDPPFTEDSPIRPNSPYAASKAAAEHLVRAAHETFDLDTIVTRCGNNFGPRQFPEKLIPLTIANALRGQPVPVYGDGNNSRDWISVDDQCRGILAAVERGRPGEVYNFGARAERRNIEIVEQILHELGRPRSLIRFVEDRPGHDRRYAIDPAKAESELGWRAEVEFSKGLSRTIRWYIENPRWLERVLDGSYRTTEI
jgi:dTDP-glucose 4,6-dehydratase